jgi:hypothetical protein
MHTEVFNFELLVPSADTYMTLNKAGAEVARHNRIALLTVAPVLHYNPLPLS